MEEQPDDAPHYRVSYRRYWFEDGVLRTTRVEFPCWFQRAEAERIAAGMSDGWVLDENRVRVFPSEKAAEA